MKMISVWTYKDEAPKFARLDYWTGLPLMVYGNILTVVALHGYEYLTAFAFALTALGGVFLLFSSFPTYLLETYDQNEEVTEAHLVGIWSYVFRIGLGRHEILSGPYSGSQLKRLEHDLEEAEA